MDTDTEEQEQDKNAGSAPCIELLIKHLVENNRNPSAVAIYSQQKLLLLAWDEKVCQITKAYTNFVEPPLDSFSLARPAQLERGLEGESGVVLDTEGTGITVE
ncbi:hypothetical protein PAAG_08877 [Paracoccidioides lutzii Pb01]|uniref:Uncharacterized protein n=1 Tax=Paracoccidioides lutzii (strain ATCC MYA-826 / Pb01) TaxID=502779 RepID=C1HDM0_PARBA|nr:hypothetical protein PAAG_08877 [Paracoccidioides lutzii Pb01]EEH40014.2 hypothetical protein PAAG_08877 [Paracoccidioides lutzii Pb01]